MDPAPQLNSEKWSYKLHEDSSHIYKVAGTGIQPLMEGQQLSEVMEKKEEERQTEERWNQAGNTTDYTRTAKKKKNEKTEYIHTQRSTSPFRCHLSSCSYFNGTLTENSSSVFHFPSCILSYIFSLRLLFAVIKDQ